MKIYVRGVGYYVPIEREFKHFVVGEYMQIQDGRIFQLVSLDPAHFEQVEKNKIKEGVRIAQFKFLK